MRQLVFLLIVISFSCGKEKSIQLPEITHSTIHEVSNVSSAYIFYNENEKDSVELNRNQLVASTTWLLNVDKRLTLRQAIPSIVLMQEEKKNERSDEKSKNLYSCNDVSNKKLAYQDFSEVVYHNGIDENIVENQGLYDTEIDETNHILSILFKENDSITINSAHSTKNEFIEKLKYMDSIQDKIMGVVYLKFNENLTFQEYITYKSMLSRLKLKHAIISNDEYIFN